ncbi:leucyl/phenylalanyl-tRNA--protein transferase [Teredinibacter turnerae]|uniref:leucyl/phenylalanyl-tRNA--protein transferase n=1 Tax=Teredinibacter turnerae TaxID=2426 RepID=UPI0030D0D34A
MSQLQWLDADNLRFPPTHSALRDPDGLLAVGGDLSPARLIESYSHGIFPWYSDGQPLLWWTPDPRMVLRPAHVHRGRTLRKLLRQHPFTITVDSAFDAVAQACGTIEREGQDGTWITQEMLAAYSELNRLGVAHSLEVWLQNELVGGLYGIALGTVFFGESMFSRVSGASKVGFSILCQQLENWGFELVDCQIHSGYLASFGAQEIPRATFEKLLAQHVWNTPRVPSAACYQSPIPTTSRPCPPLINWQMAWTAGEDLA